MLGWFWGGDRRNRGANTPMCQPMGAEPGLWAQRLACQALKSRVAPERWGWGGKWGGRGLV